MRIYWRPHALRRLGERHNREGASIQEINTALANGDYSWIVPNEKVLVKGVRLVIKPFEGGITVITFLGGHVYPDGIDYSAIQRWERRQHQCDSRKSPLSNRRTS